MGQKGSTTRHVGRHGGGGLHHGGGAEDESGVYEDIMPRLPMWAQRRGSLTSTEDRLLEDEEYDALAAEVRRLVDGPVQLKTDLSAASAPPPLLPQQAQPLSRSHNLLRALIRRRPAAATVDSPNTTTTTTTTTTTSSASGWMPGDGEADEAEFLYDMGKRMLLGREGGMELQRNPRCAVHLLQRAAEMGHVGAKWDLHCCRGQGDDITLDYARAAVLYARFAKMGHPVALSNLGVCYHKGRGVKKSMSKAVRFYSRSAQHNYARGSYNLAVCFDLGEGVTRDPAKAVEHYRQSAQLGYAVAQYYMGVCCNHAKGMEQRDFKQAIHMWRKAAKQGHGLAQLVLANYHREGQEDLLPKDVLKAARLFRAALGWGDAKAWDRLRDLLAVKPTSEFQEHREDDQTVPPASDADASTTSAEDQVRPVGTTRVPSLYDKCCLHFFNRWTHHKVVPEARAEQAQLPVEVVEKINHDVKKCHNPSCTTLRYGPGTVQRRWRLKAIDHTSEEEEESEEQASNRQLRPADDSEQHEEDEEEECSLGLEGEGEDRDEVTLHFCSHKCASAL